MVNNCRNPSNKMFLTAFGYRKIPRISQCPNYIKHGVQDQRDQCECGYINTCNTT